MEFIGGTEATKSAPALSTAKINGFSVSRLKLIFHKIFEAAICMHERETFYTIFQKVITLL